MGLKLPIAPKETQAVVTHALTRAHSSGRFALSGITGGGAAVVTPVAPHNVFTIGLKPLADGRGLGAAQPSGWRAIVVQGNHPVAAVEFTGGGGPQDYKSVNEGPLVQSSASAMAIAEELPQVKEKDYEPRLLQMPAIYLVAVWLHGDKDEILIPLDPAPGAFKAFKAYPEKDFFEQASALAKQRMGSDDAPKGQPPKRQVKHDIGEMKSPESTGSEGLSGLTA